MGELIGACNFKAAIGEVMALAREANCYLDDKAPWFQLKEDRQAAAMTLYVVLRAIDSLKTLFAPFLPFTCQQLHQYLGYEGTIIGSIEAETLEEATRSHLALRYDATELQGGWAPSELSPGQALRQPAPLFKKLDDRIVEEEMARIGGE